MIQPPHLKKGDLIGMVCPAGTIPLAKVKNCVTTLQEWGYQVQLGTTVGAKHFTFSGTDAERVKDLQQMMDNPKIKAIICGRGGYGVSRIIDQINFTKFLKNPKWIIGFSDITALHAALQKQKVMSIHGPMAAAFSKGEEGAIFINSIKSILEGKQVEYVAPAHPFNKIGKAHGRLVGGNLCLVAHLIGSPTAFQTKGKILFLEDIGEYHYSLDRMVIQMKRAGVFENLAGLIVGGFTDMKDDAKVFGANAFEIIAEHTACYDYPKCFGFPVSHGLENFALIEGGIYDLQVGKKGVDLKEA